MAYIGKSPSGTGVRSRFFYTQSTAGATSISGNDDDNRTLTFSDAEYVDVYLNGSLLAKGDYTAASNTISGLAALASPATSLRLSSTTSLAWLTPCRPRRGHVQCQRYDC